MKGKLKAQGVGIERLIKKGNNTTNRKVFGQNTKKGSQKQLGHPLASKTPLHGKHLHLTHLHGGKKNKSKQVA
jgi:hypothetical protein